MMVGDPPIISKMTTAEVDSSLLHLAAARSALLPEIPQTWEGGKVTENVMRDPAWRLETDRLAGDSLLHLRHPHFGWVHFIFSKAEAKGIGQLLVAQGTAPPPKASGTA